MYKNTKIFVFLHERKVPWELISKTLCKFKMSENVEFKFISVCFAVLYLLQLRPLYSLKFLTFREEGERENCYWLSDNGRECVKPV